MQRVMLALMMTLAVPGPGLQAATPPAAMVPANAKQPPDELMQSISQALLQELDADRESFRRDPSKLRALVDRHLLPYFDTDYAARLVLGRHWRDASAAQRKRFIEAFYQSLMQNYGDALLEFSGDRLRILPYRGDPAATTATVRAEVKRSNGTPVPVNYSLHMTPQGWKAWDVTIEGISYVKSFRTDFGTEIDEKGLDAVIERLEAKNKANKAAT